MTLDINKKIFKNFKEFKNQYGKLYDFNRINIKDIKFHLKINKDKSKKRFFYFYAQMKFFEDIKTIIKVCFDILSESSKDIEIEIIEEIIFISWYEDI